MTTTRLAFTTLAATAIAASAETCSVGGGIFHDMHDGDMKKMVVDGTGLTITPYNNKEQWTVYANLDDDCTASVDFHVPGKPGYPPVNLTATLWQLASFAGGRKVGVEFTDPSGTLADATTPLNLWLEPNAAANAANAANTNDINDKHAAAACITTKAGHGTVFDDMHDGDQKNVASQAEGGAEHMLIRPYNNNQTWAVDAPFDPKDCTALVDFDVPGKPGPPPVSLTATVWRMTRNAAAAHSKQTVEFTDPTSTIAPPATPLNGWVEVIQRS
jgi:hypothetical protein